MVEARAAAYAAAMLLAGHYQNAYVTRDLDRAMALAGARFGLGGWVTFDVAYELATPEGPREQAVRVGCAWTDGGPAALQIELIEPVAGWLDPYLAYLPPDPADPTPRFHHSSHRRADQAAVDAAVAALGLPRVCAGGIPIFQFCYADARAALGHYVEFVWATDEGWGMVGWPERRAP